jgi:competence protein ComEC
MAGFYLGLTLLVLFPNVRWRHYGQLAGVWLICGLALRAGEHRKGQFECTFLSVGHGTSVIVRSPEGQTLLYDAGRLGSPSSAARSISHALWEEGIMRLDAVTVSHADIDHYNALPELLEQFRVGTIFVSPLMFREDVEPLRVLRAAIRTSGVPLRELQAGDQLSLGESTVLSVLHPAAEGVRGSDNAQSIVLAVECCGRRVLLPGDLESPGTEALLAQPAWDCDVLLAPHHGSARSNPPGFSAWCTPEWVVISGGHANDSAGSVRSGYEAAHARVFHTADDGAVRFRFTQDSVSAFRWRDGWAPCGPAVSQAP